MLADIRSSFDKDGLQWNMAPEKKLMHLWKKLIRTEEELRKSSKEVKIDNYLPQGKVICSP